MAPTSRCARRSWRLSNRGWRCSKRQPARRAASIPGQCRAPSATRRWWGAAVHGPGPGVRWVRSRCLGLLCWLLRLPRLNDFCRAQTAAHLKSCLCPADKSYTCASTAERQSLQQESSLLAWRCRGTGLTPAQRSQGTRSVDAVESQQFCTCRPQVAMLQALILRPFTAAWPALCTTTDVHQHELDATYSVIAAGIAIGPYDHHLIAIARRPPVAACGATRRRSAAADRRASSRPPGHLHSRRCWRHPAHLPARRIRLPAAASSPPSLPQHLRSSHLLGSRHVSILRW